MKINNIEIHNILSIENASINFGDSGLILVEGFDYDTGRANGAGKSAIFNALSFALFDKIPRRITKSEILRNGTKNGWSHVEVQVGARTYSVRRERPSKVSFFIDRQPADITQVEFEKAIGMNYDQFLITMYTAQDSDNKFIALNDSAKKDFILRIMNLEFSKYKAEVAKDVERLEKEEELIKSKIETFKSNIQIYKSNMVDPVEINSQITNCNNSMAAATASINKLSKVVEPDISKYIDAEQKIQSKLMDINSKKTLSQVKRRELEQIKTAGTHCPECDVGLNIVDGKLVKADGDSKLEEHKRLIINEINSYEKDIAEEANVLQLLSKIRSKRQEEYKEYQEAQTSISTYRNTINMEKHVINDLNSKLAKNQDIKDAILKIVNDTKAFQTRLTEIATELVLLKSVENIFDSTGAPAYIMDSIVDAFNESVTNYINEIWPNASYSLQTYKQNKDNSVKAKFSESLTINGKQRSIGSLSGGEIRALSLALDFSIIEVLGSKYSLSLNPVILDEPFNGLDSAGREMVIDILMKFSENRQVWVVDHASESKALFNDIVRVEKRNGISKIV